MRSRPVPQPPRTRRWASTKKTANHLDVAERTVRQMVADGRLRGYRMGRTVRIDLKCSSCSPASAAFDDYSDLRPARQAKNITLTAVAAHFGVGSITLSRLERGQHRNHAL